MTSLLLIRRIVRTLPFLFIEGFVAFMVFLTANSTPPHTIPHWAPPTMMTIFASLGAVALWFGVKDVPAQPIDWAELTPLDFYRQREILRQARELCRLAKQRVVVLHVEENRALVVVYPNHRKLVRGFLRFAAFGSVILCELSIRYTQPITEEEFLDPPFDSENDLFYTIYYFGGSDLSTLDGPRHILEAADYNWLRDQLTAAIENYDGPQAV